MCLYVLLLVKAVRLSCIWQSHPRLLTQDPPAPGRNSKDKKQSTRLWEHAQASLCGFMCIFKKYT